MLPQTSAATSDVVVPNKSRMREEEEIQVPYARESVVERPLSGMSGASRHSDASAPFDKAGRSTPAGFDPQEVTTPRTADDRQYYDRMSFSSNVTNKSRLPTANHPGWDPETEKRVRSEYEFKIAGLERKISVLENERGEGQKREQDAAERNREWEDEVRGLKEVSRQESLI